MIGNIQEEIKDKVIDLINLSSGGRLIIFKSEKNRFGADLSVERKGNYKDKPYGFQINSIDRIDNQKGFIKDFPVENFKSDKSFYLLFVYFDEIKQKISDYVWLIPSLDFEDMADIIKLEGDKKVLRFEGFLNIENKNKFSKFLVNGKDLGKMTFESFEKGGKFDFKNSIFQEKGIINKERLLEFIIEARRNTFAANATAADNPRLQGSIQLEFQKGDYFYRDIYFNGIKNFSGQEIVYENSLPIFSLNYFGNQLKKTEEDFLKEALFRLAEKARFGGSCEYEKREYKYEDKGEGVLESFSGREQVFINGKSVFKLSYQGGILSDTL